MLTLAEYDDNNHQTGRYARLPDLTRDTLLPMLELYGISATLTDGRVYIPNRTGFLFAYQCDLFRGRPGECELSDLFTAPDSVN